MTEATEDDWKMGSSSADLGYDGPRAASAGSEMSGQDTANLRWSITCNGRGIGYLGPTVKRFGPLPELAHLVRAGLLTCVRVKGVRSADRCGYFITERGRTLANHPAHTTKDGR